MHTIDIAVDRPGHHGTHAHRARVANHVALAFTTTFSTPVVVTPTATGYAATLAAAIPPGALATYTAWLDGAVSVLGGVTTQYRVAVIAPTAPVAG